MKAQLLLISVFLMSSCVYDPPKKGIDIFIHNQTGKQIVIADSLGADVKLYDTAKVNNRVFVNRLGNYMAEYTTYNKFFSQTVIDSFKKHNHNYITLYILDENHLPDSAGKFIFSNPYRSFDINMDTISNYKLNHLFIYKDTILFEHRYDYYTK